jgi:hypothetical protein
MVFSFASGEGGTARAGGSVLTLPGKLVWL